MYVDVEIPFNSVLEEVVHDSVKNSFGPIAYQPKVIGLSNGREMKYYIAPESEGKITIPEILEFMQIQANRMVHDTAYSHDYTVGYRDAIEAIYLFIRKRVEEDFKKKDEIDPNCC